MGGLRTGLFRAHVGRGADHLFEAREQGLVGELRIGSLGDAEVDDLRHWLRAVLYGDEDVAGFEVAVDDAFLMGVLHRAADLDEQVEPLPGAEVFLVAVGGDRDATHQFHDEEWPALAALATIDDAGDVRVVHHRQRLALGFEAGDELSGVHARLEDLDRNPTAHRSALLRHVDRAEPALTNPLQ